MSRVAPVIIRQVVDRLHVSASNVDVIRAVNASFVKRYRAARSHKSARKRLYRQALAHHARNRKLYQAVMGARL